MVRDASLKNVRFTGFLERRAMEELWAKAACSIVPSIWKEPFGMVVLEAWERGRPVIAHRIGALPEIISHGTDGLLVGQENPQELAEAILSIVKNPAAGESMGRAGRKKLQERYSKKTWQDAIRPVFEDLHPLRQSSELLTSS
jgi:glycogen(starch) synthase